MPTSHRLHFRDLSYMKPEKFQDYLTLGELARVVDRDISRIRKLEQDGTIPQAQRYKLGQLEIRLWSPKQVEEIKKIVSKLRPGRPRNDDPRNQHYW
jgi:hypothetical protein